MLQRRKSFMPLPKALSGFLFSNHCDVFEKDCDVLVKRL